MSEREKFSAQLRERLADYSVRDLAQKCGWSRGTVGDWKKGTRVPSKEQLVDVLTAARASRAEIESWAARHDSLRARAAAEAESSQPAAAPAAQGATQRVQVGRPPVMAAGHQARTSVTDRIREAWRDDATGTLVLTGNGGVGKSQVATALFREAALDGVPVRIWVDATSEDQIIAAYGEAAAAVQSRGHAEGDPETRASGFLDWLETTSTPWFLVLDDVTDPSHLARWWPHGGGRALVTTRRRDAAMTSADRVRIDVDIYTAEESARFLADRLQPAVDEGELPKDALEEAALLADDLGRLPLALSQAAAVILNDAITCAQYRLRFSERGRSLGDLFPSQALADGYRRTAGTTWALAIDRANDLAPKGVAGAAVQLTAVLDPEGIPEALWSTAAARAYLTEYREGPDAGQEVSESDARQALRALHRMSLLQHAPSMPVAGVRVHAIVQRAVLDTLNLERRRQVVRASADCLMELWAEGADAALGQRLRVNAMAVVRHFEEALWEPTPHPVLSRIGDAFGDSGQYAQAAAWFRRIRREGDRRLGPEDPHTLYYGVRECDWLVLAGEGEAARGDLELLAEDCRRGLGEEHEHTLGAEYLLLALDAGKDISDDVVRFESFIDKASAVLGSDHDNVVRARERLLAFRVEHGDYGRALNEAEEINHCKPIDPVRGLAVRSYRPKVFGRAAQVLAIAENGMAAWGQGTSPKGIARLRKAIKATQELNLGEKALRELDELLREQTRVLGPEHPATLDFRARLAHFTAVLKDRAEGAAQYKAIVTDLEQMTELDENSLVRSRRMTLLYEDLEDTPDDTLDEYDSLVSEMEWLEVKPNHVALARANRCVLLARGGRNAEALAHLNDSFPELMEHFGENHPEVLALGVLRARLEAEAGEPFSDPGLVTRLADCLEAVTSA